MPLVVTNSEGSASYYDIATGKSPMRQTGGVKVMNISIAGSSSSSTLQNAARLCMEQGALIFCCCRKLQYQHPLLPCRMQPCHCSLSYRFKRQQGEFSQTLETGSILLLREFPYIRRQLGGGYRSASGTSFSSPIAAGSWCSHLFRKSRADQRRSRRINQTKC